MRSATFCAVLALAAATYAVEGPLPHTHLHSATGAGYRDFAITDRLLDVAGVADLALREEIKSKAKELNAARKGLREQLGGARQKLAAAQREVNQVLDDLERQEAAFHGFLVRTLGDQAARRFALRRELQPIIEWLKLDDAQVAALMQAQGQLDLFGVRKKLAEAAKLAREEAVQATPDLSAMTYEQRKAYREARAAKRDRARQLVKDYTDFERQWLKNIWDVIRSDPERSRIWAIRFRRTRFTVEGAPPPEPPRPAPPPPLP